MKKESPCGFSSASAIIWYCNPVPFHDIYTSFATSFFQVVVTLPLGLLALQCSQFRVSPALERPCNQNVLVRVRFQPSAWVALVAESARITRKDTKQIPVQTHNGANLA